MDIYKDAADRLAQPGAIGVIPTDTVYGVVCRAADAVAVKRLYALKQRAAKPGTVMAATIETVRRTRYQAPLFDGRAGVPGREPSAS